MKNLDVFYAEKHERWNETLESHKHIENLKKKKCKGTGEFDERLGENQKGYDRNIQRWHRGNGGASVTRIVEFFERVIENRERIHRNENKMSECRGAQEMFSSSGFELSRLSLSSSSSCSSSSSPESRSPTSSSELIMALESKEYTKFKGRHSHSSASGTTPRGTFPSTISPYPRAVKSGITNSSSPVVIGSLSGTRISSSGALYSIILAGWAPSWRCWRASRKEISEWLIYSILSD